MSGREKVWIPEIEQVVWVHLPDDAEEQDLPDDLWADLILALECLTKKQRFVIECRYGLRRGMTGESLEFADIAYLMGITKQAVQQLETRAIERMREWATH